MRNIIKEVLSELTSQKLNEAESFNIPANLFDSGKDEVTPELEQQLKVTDGPKLVKFLKSNPSNMVDIIITSSESKVPNQAPFDKPGSLAQSRGDKLKSFFERNLPKYKNQVRYKIKPIVSGPAWDGTDKDAQKYKDAQYIKVTYQTSSEKIPSTVDFKSSSFCKTKKIEFSGGQGQKPNFLGYYKKFEVGYGDGNFNISFIPYMYPDRLIMKSGNQKVDTGFVSSKGVSQGLFQHILMLSVNYYENPNSPAFKGIQTIIDISKTPPNEVLTLILNTMKKQGISLSGYDNPQTKKFVEDYFGQDKPIQKLVYYTQSPGYVNLVKDSESQFVEVGVFSPVADTKFDIMYNCM